MPSTVRSRAPPLGLPRSPSPMHLPLLLLLLLSVAAPPVSPQTLLSPPQNASGLVGAHPAFRVAMSRAVEPALGQYVRLWRVLGPGDEVLAADHAGPAADPAKYGVTGAYTFYVKDARVEDEGQYKVEVKGSAPGTSTFDVHLTVSVPPNDARLSWFPGDRLWTPAETRANLTCRASAARPPATLRWFRAGRDVSHLAVLPHSPPPVDADGYGEAVSALDLYVSWADEDEKFRCLADVPGGAGLLSRELRVAFSRAGPGGPAVGLLLQAAVSATLLGAALV